MRRHSLYGLVVVAAFLAACDTKGEFIKEDEFETLQTEIVSAEQLVEALGPPSVTIPRSDGTVVWLYEGIYRRADVGSYIPYLNLLVGSNTKTCTSLSVVVNQEDGSLSEWTYESAKDTDFWAQTDEDCNEETEEKPRRPVMM